VSPIPPTCPLCFAKETENKPEAWKRLLKTDESATRAAFGLGSAPVFVHLVCIEAWRGGEPDKTTQDNISLATVFPTWHGDDLCPEWQYPEYFLPEFFQRKCSLCSRKDGACLRCVSCKKNDFHPLCGALAGWTDLSGARRHRCGDCVDSDLSGCVAEPDECREKAIEAVRSKKEIILIHEVLAERLRKSGRVEYLVWIAPGPRHRATFRFCFFFFFFFAFNFFCISFFVFFVCAVGWTVGMLKWRSVGRAASMHSERGLSPRSKGSCCQKSSCLKSSKIDFKKQCMGLVFCFSDKTVSFVAELVFALEKNELVEVRFSLFGGAVAVVNPT
jgi:hypothetical protein